MRAITIIKTEPFLKYKQKYNMRIKDLALKIDASYPHMRHMVYCKGEVSVKKRRALLKIFRGFKKYPEHVDEDWYDIIFVTQINLKEKEKTEDYEMRDM